MESRAVIGEAMSERIKESLKALKPLYFVKTWPNHLVVRWKS